MIVFALTIPHRLKLYYSKMPISGQIACCVYATGVAFGRVGVFGASGQEIKPAKCHLRQNVHSISAPLLLSCNYSRMLILCQIKNVWLK